ncbi:hypothetical protein tinsulaeT_35210 [Thalassotalea insulae]|uniref:EamA domain-containing protein n=1 Tax=Thalassotalea insulae TaxID=2056778 RepID=A0ABQ6H175_9GAMM|nr:DMT family transporter [Thalassotalea insulae]GLX80181.1 hypothetical protein tinsulaeT_35210 [Thalassotalea insulae]
MIVRPIVELPLLAAIWGGSFLLMKIGGPEFGPILYMALRTIIASIFLLILLARKQQLTSLISHKKQLFIVGLMNTAIPFVLFGWATLTLSAGSTSVLNATVPMFGAIVAFFWLKDRLNITAILGLCLGFLGVYVLMLDKINAPDSQVIIPMFAVLLAALFYAIGANYTKKYLTGLKPLTLATGSQLAASSVLLPLSMFYFPSQLPSIAAINSVLLLGVLCTGFAYILFFRLIAEMGPTKAISVTYLIPAFGLFWGAVFLKETITLTMLAGCALILIGVALTTGMLAVFKRTALSN